MIVDLSIWGMLVAGVLAFSAVVFALLRSVVLRHKSEAVEMNIPQRKIFAAVAVFTFAVLLSTWLLEKHDLSAALIDSIGIMFIACLATGIAGLLHPLKKE